MTIAPFGPAPIGVPNFVIDSFEIPPFLLPIYQACGTEYGIPWEVLASINKIETAFGTNLNVSSAGAVGWMQFLPSSWETYGLDANGDGRQDPYNPVDAICAAAHYLKVAGGTKDLYGAILAYNHADWYVQEVLLYARAYGKLPTDLVGSLTGLTEGAHFPVAADARYADDISARAALAKATPETAQVLGQRRRRHLLLADAARDQHLRRRRVPGRRRQRRSDREVRALGDPRQVRRPRGRLREPLHLRRARAGSSATTARWCCQAATKSRFRSTRRTSARGSSRYPDGQRRAPRQNPRPKRGEEVDVAARKGADGTLKVGSKVIAGTVFGRIGKGAAGVDPHINFSIRPAGKGAPRIDPKPILDGWKLLEETAIYRANGKNALAVDLGGAGVLLLSKEELVKRVLADPASKSTNAAATTSPPAKSIVASSPCSSTWSPRASS